MTTRSTTSTGSSPAKVLRFTLVERGLHWALALPFLVATSTGLLLGSGHRVGIDVNHFATRRLHIVSGLALVVLPAAVMVTAWCHDSVRLHETVRSLAGHPPCAGITASAPPRFNAGQQVFAGLVAAGVVLGFVSGIELWQWHWFPLAARRGALALHQALGYGYALAIVGHLYLAVIHPTTRWTLPGIVTGFVRNGGGRRAEANEALQP